MITSPLLLNLLALWKYFGILEILIVGLGLLIGLILSWVMNLPGGDIFIWIFCLFLGLKVGEIILSDEDKDDDDDDLGGGILIPDFQGI